MNKIIGYVIAILGIIGLAAWSVPEIRTFIETAIKIKLPSDTILLIAGIVITAVGLFLAIKSRGIGFGRKRVNEVPIYKGNQVVGYRRH